MKEHWISVKELAARLDVNPDTIYKWITRKKMPAHKLGRLWKSLATTMLPIAQQVSLPGPFDLPVTLESARPLAKGLECRVRLPGNSQYVAVHGQGSKP